METEFSDFARALRNTQTAPPDLEFAVLNWRIIWIVLRKCLEDLVYFQVVLRGQRMEIDLRKCARDPTVIYMLDGQVDKGKEVSIVTRPGVQVCYVKLRFEELDRRDETGSLDTVLVQLVWMPAAHEKCQKFSILCLK